MPRVVFEGESTLAVRAQKAMTDALDQYEKQTDKATKSSRALEAAAAKVHKNNEGPQQRYNRRMGELAELVKAGKIQFDSAASAAQKYTQQLEHAGAKGRGSFGSSAANMLAGYAAGVLGIENAFSLVTTAIGKTEEAANSALERIKSSYESAAELGQLGEEGIEAQAFGKKLRKRVGGISAEQANDIGAQLKNLGATKQEEKFLLGLAESEQVKFKDLPAYFSGLRKYQNAYGAAEAGSLQQISDKVLTAANKSDSTAAEVLSATTKFGGAAGRLKITDEEALAGWLEVNARSPNPEVAATRFNSTLNSIYNKRLGKNNLVETMRGIRERVAAGEQVNELLGSNEAGAGYDNLNLGFRNLRKGSRELEIAQDSGISLRPNAVIENDPSLRAERVRKRAVTRAEMLAEDKQQVAEALLETIRNEVFVRRGGGARAYALDFLDFDLGDRLGQDDALIRDQYQRNQRAGGTLFSDALGKELAGYMRRTAQAVEKRPIEPRQE